MYDCLGSELQLGSRSAQQDPILFELMLPRQALLRVLAEAQEGKPKCANTLHMCLCACSHPVGKAGHMAKPIINGAPMGHLMEVGERGMLTFWDSPLHLSNALNFQLL